MLFVERVQLLKVLHAFREGCTIFPRPAPNKTPVEEVNTFQAPSSKAATAPGGRDAVSDPPLTRWRCVAQIWGQQSRTVFVTESIFSSTENISKCRDGITESVRSVPTRSGRAAAPATRHGHGQRDRAAVQGCFSVGYLRQCASLRPSDSQA
eukprot:732005-Rhodomonas_salina.1